MENQFQCTKIKDGLYLGNLTAIQDYQFLQINKFSYIVNCSAQIPNYFDSHGIKYLKFKLIKERTHKLWDESLKKLRKLQKFIEEAEEQSLCCIISSATGNNRSLVMLTAYLMSKYRWTLSKTLEYIRSKKIYIGLSEHYIEQLQHLQSMLNKEEEKAELSSTWRGPYVSDEENLLSKTYLNSQEISLDNLTTKQKTEKRVTWQDKIDKERKKQLREQKMRQTGIEGFKKIKSTHKFAEESNPNPHNSLSTKAIKQEQIESPLKKPEGVKKGKKSQKNKQQGKPQIKQEIKEVKQEKQQFPQFEETQDQQDKKQSKGMQDHRYFSEKELLKLLKHNLKMKKQTNSKQKPSKNQEQNEKGQRGDRGVYKLTINNFISPNINIMNSLADKTNNQKSTKVVKGSKKEDKNGRTHSEKQTASRQVNDSLKNRFEKGNKNYKRNTENSPRARQKKIEKAASLQFKKNI